MNLIKFKQIQGLTDQFTILKEKDQYLFDKIYDVASGDFTFGGDKTFLGETIFSQDVHLIENLSVQGSGYFDKVGINFPLDCHPDKCLDQAFHITGANQFIEDGNIYVSGEIWSTGIDGQPGQIYPTLQYWTVKPDKEIYYDDANVGIGTGNPSYPLHVKGDTKINGNLWVTGNVTGECFISTKAGTMLIEANDALRIKSTNGTEIISDDYVRVKATGDINLFSYGVGGDINISGFGEVHIRGNDAVRIDAGAGTVELEGQVVQVKAANWTDFSQGGGILTDLPTSDPLNSGELWQDTAAGTLMVSQG